MQKIQNARLNVKMILLACCCKAGNDVYSTMGKGKEFSSDISMATTISMLEKTLSQLLHDERICSSIEEGQVMAELVLGDLEGKEHEKEAIQQSLEEYLDIPSPQAKDLVNKIFGEQESPHEEEQSEIEVDESNLEEPENDEDDGTWLDDGECELCDRYMKLTRHHLIPKSTWPKLRSPFTNAAQAKQDGDEAKACMILGTDLEHLYVDLSSTEKKYINRLLARTCAICRPCHTAIHKVHDNMGLALNYNTIELLLADEQVSKFCKWASKQRTGKYSH